MVPFDAESYKTFMETKMPSWLDAHVTALDFKSFDGRMIRCYEIPGEIPDSIDKMIRYEKVNELFN